MTDGRNYVHGYSPREAERLLDQARTLTDLLHGDSIFPEGSSVLEAGCGVGAQTVVLAARNPEVEIVSLEISGDSLARAEERVREQGLCNVRFQQGDLYDPPFEDRTFDHLFLCFVLEHLPDVPVALRRLSRLIRPGGSVTVIEGDHGSAYFHPDSAAARKTVQCLIDLQARGGGDALIGRRLYPLLQSAGLEAIAVSPRMVYVDDSRPDLVQGFTRDTFVAMVQGVEQEALAAGLVTPAEWCAGVKDLEKTASGGGTFCYTFFKATARIPAE